MVTPESLLLLQMVRVGLEVAQEVNRFTGSIDPNPRRQREHMSDYVRLLDSSTQSLKRAISMGTDRVIDKIESDKMEELGSRLKNLDRLVRLSEQGRLLEYTLHVQESVDYACNRLAEGKRQWFLPYITGTALVAATYRYLGKYDSHLEEVLSDLIDQAREMLLNEVVADRVQSNRSIPWETIRDVLNDEPDSLVALAQLLPEPSRLPAGNRFVPPDPYEDDDIPF